MICKKDVSFINKAAHIRNLEMEHYKVLQSALGSLLFLIYVNDVSRFVTLLYYSFSLYADAITLSCHLKDECKSNVTDILQTSYKVPDW